jgi:hypothetical protein
MAEAKWIRCDSCGAVSEETGKFNGLDQFRVGGQHVCDRFEAGIFRRCEVPIAGASAGETTEEAGNG